MNLFNYNFKDVLLYVEEAYVKIYGNQYRKIIHDRLMAAQYVFYNEKSDKDFKEKCEQIGFDLNDEFTKTYLSQIEENSDMVVSQVANNGKLTGIMFFPISREINGTLDFFFLHECGHIIDQNDYYHSGFDLQFHDYVNVAGYREYEVFDEATTDIFALECRDVLHNSGIYLADKNKLTLDSENNNMLHEIKELVRLLVDDYRKEIIEAKLTGNYNVLFDKVGKENFDKFNLIINKTMHLIEDGLLNAKNQELFKEYYELIEKAEEVLAKMKDYNIKDATKR